ncbi:hypothetical protein [Cellulomonas sp.]|uniref:hypothetical protein n=1 Tax=Cellulomonas sp. TaxID=40001 RepID=UPI001B18F992|nr:hypothetical protein [Cellulomonas sp.]MBO9555553.1 hypothetical protein [Cellulomonas sp.]
MTAVAESARTDDTLREGIIDLLVEERSAHYEPESGYYRVDADEFERLIEVVITATTERVAEEIEGRRDGLDLVGTTASAVRGALTDAAAAARALGALEAPARLAWPQVEWALCYCTDRRHEYPDRETWKPDRMTALRDEIYYSADLPHHLVSKATAIRQADA